jgi:uncharacterized protein YjbK
MSETTMEATANKYSQNNHYIDTAACSLELSRE